MNLSEVKTERTFNLEISESDLVDLLSVVVFYPVVEGEGYTDRGHNIISYFHNMCLEHGIRVPSRTNFIEENGETK